MKKQKKLNPAFWILTTMSLAVCLYVFLNSEMGKEFINLNEIMHVAGIG